MSDDTRDDDALLDAEKGKAAKRSHTFFLEAPLYADLSLLLLRIMPSSIGCLLLLLLGCC